MPAANDNAASGGYSPPEPSQKNVLVLSGDGWSLMIGLPASEETVQEHQKHG